MKMKIPRTNLQQQLNKTRNKRIAEDSILQEIREILDKDDRKEAVIKRNLQDSKGHVNSFDIDLLEAGRIFYQHDIYKLCVDYRLRFLDASLYKAEIPYEAILEIKQLSKEQGIELKGFKIMAPAKVFKLKNADDPLLFAPMGNDYYYLVHKWGKDLHPLRRMLMWPLKSLENFLALLLLTSFITALLVPDGLFSPQQTTTQFFMIFFFIFKWFAGLSIFYGFKMGKNFSGAIWDSKYFNA